MPILLFQDYKPIVLNASRLRACAVVLVLLGTYSGFGQVILKGTVYNMYRTRPLQGVSVISSSGKGTQTDSNGNYMISLKETDSVSFSYLGRSTTKYPVASIQNISDFDIALHVDPLALKEVSVFPRYYRQDSIQNRKDYQKVFDFKKPGLSINPPGQGLGVGLDLDELINVFRFQRTRRMLAFQRRLLSEEEEKFIDHRFNRSIVRKITKLEGDELDSFMVRFRPSFEFTATATDYEFLQYIKLAFEYATGKIPLPGELKKLKE